MTDMKPIGAVYRYGKDSAGRQWHGIHWDDPAVDVPHGTKLFTEEQLNAALAAERERSAKVCEALERGSNTPHMPNGFACAAAIRYGAPARDDGMPADPDERHLRRLLAVRVAMPLTYYDDGEALGREHDIMIDFMREPVADLDAKLRALNMARAGDPARERRGLTDADVLQLRAEHGWAKETIRAIEAKLLEEHMTDEERNKLRDYVRRLRQNDARYRLLRSMHWSEDQLAVVVDPKKSIKLGHQTLSEARLDEFLDELLRQRSVGRPVSG